MNNRQISNPGFLIDLDGLLINSETLSLVAFEKMCQSLGCEFTQNYHASIRGMRKTQWAQDFVLKFGLDISSLEVANLHSSLLLTEMNKSVRLMPGAKLLLSWIAQNGYASALVTSSDRNYATTYLRRLQIADFFVEIVSAEDVKSGKPNPEPYLIGAQRIEREPGNCIVLEDSVNGVLAGKASGAVVIAVPSTDSDKEKMSSSDYVVPSLIEALEIVKGMGL